MKLERLLQINVATLVALGALLLGMGQHSTSIPFIAVFAAVVSFYATDVLCWIRLNTNLANAAGILAAIVCLAEFFENRQEEELFAIANLLVYLQIILLFQQKTNRVYAHLLVLSLLQVVVASALGLHVYFGVILVLYLFVTLSAQSLFFFHREFAKHSAQDQLEKPHAFPDNQLLQVTATYEELTSRLKPSHVVRSVWSMGMSTLLIACGVFVLIPRLGSSSWHGTSTTTHHLGFVAEVKLDEVSHVVDNETRVMRVSYYDRQTNQSYSLAQDPYLRGTVLTKYSFENHDGMWSLRHATDSSKTVDLQALPQSQDVVRQEIVMEPRRDQLLFSVFPVYRINNSVRVVKYDGQLRQLVRVPAKDRRLGDQFRFDLLTTAFVSGRQRPMIPCLSEQADLEHSKQLATEIESLREFKEERMPTLKATADQIVSDVSILSGDRVALAHALQSYFRNSGEYRYTLDFSAVTLQRNANIDPIEDFVANHHTGHCEYFASALAMMLRSQGIPSRLVVGYRGGDFNVVGKYYQVREKHTHVWVEAYLEADQIPPDYFGSELLQQEGAWLRLDATPVASVAYPASTGMGILSHITQWVEYSQLLWSEYVVGLNAERQYKSIYRPLIYQVKEAVRLLFDREAWHRLMSGFLSGKWFNWRAGLVTAIVLLMLSGALRLLKDPFWQLIGSLRSRQRPAPGRKRGQIEFYLKFETLLARYGWTRSAGTTQREFALEVNADLVHTLSQRAVAAIPRRLVETFYRVRFGGEALDVGETQSLERSLEDLERALSSRSSDE